MKIALVGQPNSGKSTIYNSVAGYKSATSNLPGTTVKYTQSRVRMNGTVAHLVDFPGTYSLSSTNEAESEVSKYLLDGNFDLIINVIDASQLGRSLPLTLELMELGIPIVIGLNMMDEASRKGIEIDHSKLEEILGIPVQTTVASKNLGVRDLFVLAKSIIQGQHTYQPIKVNCQRDVEEVIAELKEAIERNLLHSLNYPSRFLAVKLLEDDDYYKNLVINRNG
ncbi:MAG: GTP-binding protein, partial [Calditrichaeota bacterium]